jgi:serine/threonine protein kinase
MAFPFKLPPRYVYEGPTLSGGQGDVYVCRDTYLNRKVAIKVLVDSGDTVALRKELSAIQSVRSRHVAQLYDTVRPPKGAGIGLVQEFVPGPTVNDYQSGSDPTHDFIRVLYQIACGIADIHKAGKIHRDIKPSNIRLDGEGVVKILDFGLTSKMGVDAVTIDARGTMCYLAPELYVTAPIKLSPAIDTFAFGVTARVIAEGGAMLPVFRQTPPYRTAFPSFSGCSLSLPTEVVALLDKTLSVAPSDRPLMSEIRDLLGRRLLYGKHRAVVTYGQMHELSKPGKSISLSIPGVGATAIKYDGLLFTIESVSGNVYINNRRAVVGEELPDSCVITIGAPVLGAGRTFAPFNVSHPGVVL